MSKKSITDFFKFDLQAPLKNTVWSWGAVSTDAKRQALRVWAHEYKRIDGVWWVAIDYVVIPAEKASHGAPERRGHVEALRAGRPTVGVIVTAVDSTAHSKKIAHYDGADLVVLTNEFRTIGNDLYARVAGKIAPREFLALS